MAKVNKILFLNQMAGPLFRELAEGLSLHMQDKSTLYTGHRDTLAIGSSSSKLTISKAPHYNKSSNFFRIISWVSYSLFVFWKMLRLKEDTIILIVSNPPFLGFFTLIVNFIKKTKYVVLVYDMHVDILVGFGMLKKNSPFVKFWRFINRKVWERSIAVFTIGDIMAENINKQFQVKNTKLARVGVVYPWSDTNKIKPISKFKNPFCNELHQANKITILYSGNMGISHDIESIVEAARILKSEKKISFLLIGEGKKWQYVCNYQKENSLDNLQVLPFQPEENLPFTMSLADIAIVTLEDGAESFMIPSKISYYMSGGAAIIAVCKHKNDVSEIIQKSNSGIIVEPKNPVQLARTIKMLSKDIKKLNQFKKNARKFAVSNFSRERCTDKFNRELLSIIN